MKTKHWMVACIIVTLSYACSKQIADEMTRFLVPGNFPEPQYHFATNEITTAKFELGRKLFYEPRFSRDNTVSCGSCHIQSSAFTQHGHDVSHGIDDRLGSRNSQSLTNLAWSKTFFWDGGVPDLDLQPIVPITNPVEMDETINNVIVKLKGIPDYQVLFKAAFGTAEINSERMMKALSQFMVMLVSSASKYDKVMRGEGVAFTETEKKGYDLFRVKCSSCHKEPLFTDGTFRNNGIRIGSNNDPGRYAITLNESDKYKFKVPSLRNISYTAPYMHDGRFITLDAVLGHYAGNLANSLNPDSLMFTNGEPGIRLTEIEKNSIIAFLKTLDDQDFITDNRFAEQ